MIYYPEGTNPRLTKTFASAEEVKVAMKSGEVVEGKVLLCDRGHNLHIDLGAVRGIIPREEGALGIREGTVRDIALISKVGKTVCFKIIGFHRDDSGLVSAILSRRMVQLECMRDCIDTLRQGDVIDAVVTHLEQFGAFIDIGAGINSLIPIDMLAVARINHPSERLYPGEKIKAVLRKREPEKLTFSLKELLGTWCENAALFSVGETVTGVVRSLEEYGVFVELMPNLAGLAEPGYDVEVGQTVSVFVKSIIPEKMKIKLVIVESFDIERHPKELRYFVSGSHTDRWDYSYPDCKKLICTEF